MELSVGRIVFRNGVVPPSWTLILPESWDESKSVLKGAVDGFKIGEGRGGEEKIRLPAAVVRLANPYTRSTGTLIGAVSEA